MAPIVPVLDHGKALEQPVFVEDLGEAVAEAALDPNTARKEYDLGGDEPVAYSELISLIAGILGRKPLIVSIPLWAEWVTRLLAVFLDLKWH